MYAILPFAYLVLRQRWKYGAVAMWVLSVVLALVALRRRRPSATAP